MHTSHFYNFQITNFLPLIFFFFCNHTSEGAIWYFDWSKVDIISGLQRLEFYQNLTC